MERKFLEDPCVFRVTGLRKRLRVLYRVLVGRPMIDVYAYEDHARAVAQHNHKHHVMHITELDDLRNGIADWAARCKYRTITDVCRDLQQIRERYADPNHEIQYPWEESVADRNNNTYTSGDDATPDAWTWDGGCE